MASTEVDNLPVVSTRRLEDSIVAPQTFGSPVLNHLLETKVFATDQDSTVVKTKPRVIHFSGYELDKLHQQTLRIVNCCTDNLKMHIIPPSTDHFSILYNKSNSTLVPGLSLDITVRFTPSQWKYYYDTIRIHCKGNSNLLIPIHAYPVMDTSNYPRSIKFPSTPVGQSKTKSFSLNCNIPIDFEFHLTCTEAHGAFTVSPTDGTVPANGKVVITVTFTPTDFSTATMKLQLDTSQFNSKPLTCLVSGNSAPGLALKQYKQKTAAVKDIIAGVEKHSEKKRLKSRKQQSRPLEPQSGTVMYKGIEFPANLSTPSAIGKVLAQEAGKMRASQVKKARAVTPRSNTSAGSSRQLKEALFLENVKEVAELERANKLRWATHLGSSAMTDTERQKVLQIREEATRIYERRCHVATVDEEAGRKLREYNKRRTRRQANMYPDFTPSFDLMSNNPWNRRMHALSTFVQAGQKVMLQLRCEKRLKMLRRHIMELKSGKKELSEIDVVKEQESSVKLSSPALDPSLLIPSLLPHYKHTQNNTKTVQYVAATISTPATELQREVPLLDLRVPEQHRLLGYCQYPLPYSYAAPGLPRPLRTGAEDEYAGLTEIVGVDSRYSHTRNSAVSDDAADDFVTTDTDTDTNTGTDADIGATDIGAGDGAADIGAGTTGTIGTGGMLPLVPPPSWIQVHLCQPLHILNPSPVVESIRPLIHNSELTFEHHLLPLPTPSAAPHPQPELDPQDGVPGIMSWRQFPRPFLIEVEKSSSLTSIWRPHLSDPYSTELLPTMSTPHQLMGPQSDDIVDATVDNLPVPTSDMINSEFLVPVYKSEISLCNREECEMELYCDYQAQTNQLGKQHKQKLQQLAALLSYNNNPLND